LLIKKKEYVIQTRYTWTWKTRNRKPNFYFLYSTAFPQPGMIWISSLRWWMCIWGCGS
jgi:hypothetical protein